MNLRHLVLAVGGIGSAGLVACGGAAPVLQVQSAAAVVSPAPTATTTRCDAGAWTGAISPEGRPDSLDAGDAGAVYIWHDSDGWHIRATDRRATDHHYTGTIRLEPVGASFANVRPVRDERDDRITVDANNVLHYDFHTYASVDGVDFIVTCPPDQHVKRERLGFHTEFDGHPMADRVRIGDTKRSPASADFSFARTV